MCKACGCNTSDKKDPNYGKGPKKAKKTVAKKKK